MILRTDRPAVLFTLLPGPDRKRPTHSYGYRLTFRTAEADASGCVMLWEVSGGRLDYQIALERDDGGGLRLHCSCADAVYRCESEGRHCKHIRGLVQIGCRDTAPLGIGASGFVARS
jgi:hypothetical protein